MNNIDILRINEEDKDNQDPFKFRDGLVPVVKSFTTMNPMHSLLQNYLYSQSPQNSMYHHKGVSIRGQDTGPLQDASLGIHIFMGGINSNTGFTSKENDFSILAPIVLFKGKQSFTCRWQNYPVFTVGLATARSDAPTLPAESFSVEFSVDMFAVKIVIEPEANLLCLPEARLREYLFRKEQTERSINQTMQEQITHALGNCPSLTLARFRKEIPNLSKLMMNPSQMISDLVYSEIQKQATEFCSWTLDPISVKGHLQDLDESLMQEERSGSLPNYIVTTPETASMIATHTTVTPPTDVLYTVQMKDDDGEFYPGQILPYSGVSKVVSLSTNATEVNGRSLPILKVPHLSNQSGKRYNTFERTETFWVYNEVGYNSKGNTEISDYNATDRTQIRVTDLHSGRDGTFTMDTCLQKGGGLLPATYNRYNYEKMLKKNNGLLQHLLGKTNERGLIDLIGGSLPQNSPYNLYFPSPKVRFHSGLSKDSDQQGQCHFRSTGIYGNRPSFDNWHPPSGDLEAAKDWMAKKIHVNKTDLDDVFDYLKKCSEIAWTKQDIISLDALNGTMKKGMELADSIQPGLEDINMKHIIKDMIDNKGYTKFIGMPRFADALATIANKMLQYPDLMCEMADINDREDIFMKRAVATELEKIVNFRSKLFAMSKRFMAMAHRVDLPCGFLTTCPPSTPVYDLPDSLEKIEHMHQSSERDTRDVRAAYTFYLLCIAPLVFRHIYTLDEESKEHVSEYIFLNPDLTKVRGDRQRETFLQPVFLNGFLSSVAPSIMTSISTKDIIVRDVTAYDPLYSFDVSFIHDNMYNRSENFFDHFVSHRFQYLRETNNESFAIKVMAAFLNMISYQPTVEKSIGHSCLMNRKYRIIRQCGIDVDMVGMYRGGRENMMYAVGNLSTVTKQTANNGIMITQRVNGNCFIIDPQSSGRVIPNAVSKRLTHGMTSCIADIHSYHEKSSSNLAPNWWRNSAYVIEGLPGQHPLFDQHNFVPLNGRHLKENLNGNGFDLKKIDNVGKGGGWVAENMYSLKGYSEAQIVYGDLATKNRLPLYDDTVRMDGFRNLHDRAVVDRREMAGKVVEKSVEHPIHTIFTGSSNIGFLERQTINITDSKSCFINDSWPSKSPLKEKSCSDTRFVETLFVNHRGTDRGLKVLDHNMIGYDERTQPYMTGVKGRYTTESVK